MAILKIPTDTNLIKMSVALAFEKSYEWFITHSEQSVPFSPYSYTYIFFHFALLTRKQL